MSNGTSFYQGIDLFRTQVNIPALGTLDPQCEFICCFRFEVGRVMFRSQIRFIG